MGFDVSRNRDFVDSIIGRNYILDFAVDWIRNNLNPEDIFTVSQLEEWALSNGYEEEKSYQKK